MKKIFYLVISLYFFGMCGGLYFLTMTRSGLVTDLEILHYFLPGKLNVSDVTGALFSDFTLKNIRYEDNLADTQIHSFHFAWKPRDLWIARLHVTSFDIQQATITLKPSTQSSTSEIPIPSYLRFIQMDQINLTDIKIQSSGINTVLNGSYHQHWQINWQIDIPKLDALLKETPGSFRLSGTITGLLSSPVIDSNITDLSLLTTLIPQLKDPKGYLRVHLVLDGSTSKPKVFGEIELMHGEVTIPTLGITPDHIHLQGKINNTLMLTLTGTFQSGKGDGILSGNVNFAKPDLPISLSVRGNNLLAVNLPEYQMTLSPNLTLHYVNFRTDLQGDITVPSATIATSDFDSTITLPSDVVFVTEKKTEKSLPIKTTLQLKIHLGKNIHIRSRDLTATLNGDLHISQQANSAPIVTGDLAIEDGLYQAYGQKLQINHGRLIYLGNTLSNPGLDITAIKNIRAIEFTGNQDSFSSDNGLAPIVNSEKITVGVRVEGTLNHPIISLFSIPVMSQGDMLSYLILGAPQSQAKGQKIGALLTVLSALNPNDSSISNLIAPLQNRLGLSELSLGSTQVYNPMATGPDAVTTTTTLGIGKELAPHLFLHYTVGLLAQASILNVRYQFKPGWAIQSESSSVENGIDLLYGFERD